MIDDNLEYEMPSVEIISVSDISYQIRVMIQDTFPIVYVRGQVANFTKHSNGHLYFSLKDEKATINAICWNSAVQNLPVIPEDGMEIVVKGRLTTYEATSRYQIVVDDIIVEGTGDLAKKFAELKKRLQIEGVFSKNKKPIPMFPKEIGVITSPTGAVIHDIMYQFNERYPVVIAKLYPVLVQGEKAAGQIIEAIEYFNNLVDKEKPDVLILARGGGSEEDLWCFNDEYVVRAVAKSQIPIITAIGHETDTTLVDYASDKFAPTPTAAAQMSTPNKMDILSNINGYVNMVKNSFFDKINYKKLSVSLQSSKLQNPLYTLEQYKFRLDSIFERLNLNIHNQFTNKKKVLEQLVNIIDIANPHNILKRGFAWVSDEKGNPIQNKNEIKENEIYELNFIDGKVNIKKV